MQNAPAPTTCRAPQGWLRLATLSAVIIGATVASGCVTRTVYVTESPDQPNQVAQQPTYTGAPYNGTYQDAPVVNDVSRVNEFYSSLAAYGTWTYHNRYGQVFVPAVRVTGPNFRPYSRGNWEYTEWGWTFVSHQPFGWATAHYGRWFYDSRLGWAWVPGTQWSPAWVTWRTGGGYVGWAPMPPGATYTSSYNVYSTGWVFVGYNNFGADVIYPVMIRGSRYDDCYRRTRPYRATISVRGRYVYRGPNPNDVRSNGGRVTRRPLRDIDRDRPTSRPPKGVTVTRVRERDGGDRKGYNGRDRTRGAEPGRDRTRGRDRDNNRDRGTGRDRDNRGSKIIDDSRDVERRGRVTNRGDDRDRSRDRDPNSGSKIIDNNRGLDQRDRVTREEGMSDRARDRDRGSAARPGSAIIDDDRNLGRRERPVGTAPNLGISGEAGLNVNNPNRGSRASRDDESSNADLGSRSRPSRGSTVIDNDRGVRPGSTPDYGRQRAPDLGAEIPDDRPQRPYTDSPSGPDARTRYRREAPSNPGVLPKPAPMTKPSGSVRRSTTPTKRAPTTTRSRSRRSAPKAAPAPKPKSSSKSKSSSKAKSSSKKSDDKKSSRRRRRR